MSETGLSVCDLYPLLGDHHGPLDLLKWDKHHNVPRSQPQKWRNKSRKKKDVRERIKCVFNLHIFMSWCIDIKCLMMLLERKVLPFVESCWTLFSQHSPGTVHSALVLTRWWVHIPSFDNIHRGSYHRSNKASTKCRHEVTWQVVCWESWGNKC